MIRKITRSAVFLLFISVLISGCRGFNGDYTISQEEAVRLIEEDNGSLIVDVRTKKEYDTGHIPDAMLLPIEDIRAGKLDKLPDKDQILLLYCRTGRRAEDAADILQKKGYIKVYSFGGIYDWKGEVVK